VEKIKGLVIKYVAAICIGLGIAGTVLILADYSAMTELIDKYRTLADAFTIPGVLYIMVGCLVFVSTDGFFDMISYGFKKAGSMLLPFVSRFKSEETFYDYKQRKNENRIKGYSFLFFTGLAFLAVAGIFMLLFFNIYS
jgi:hypothetical protein